MRNLLKYALDYSQQPFDQTHAKFRKLKLLEQIRKYRHDIILEIGCGLHPLFEDFTDFKELIILEPSGEFFNNAARSLEQFPELVSKVILINDYLEAAVDKIKAHKPDYIVLSNVLHEIENVPVFLKDLHKVCYNNTLLHVIVPNAKSFHRVLAYEMGIIDSIYQLSDRNILLQQQTVFDLDILTELLAKNGFCIIESGTSFIKPFTHKQMQFMLENKIIDDVMLKGLYKMIKYMPELGSEIYVNAKI